MNARESPLVDEAPPSFARDRAAPSSDVARLPLRGRLNLFQIAMLRWRELHPYNAVHVVRVSRPFDRARAEAAIAEQLTASGLTGLVLDRVQQRYEYRGGPATVELEIVTGERNGDSILRVEIERQLNRPFPVDGPLVPFRFFAVADGESFQLGLAYDHFVAGGDSIAVLLNDVVARYSGQPTPQGKPNIYPPTFRPLFVRNAGALVRGLPALSRIIGSCRRSVRPRYRNHQDGHNGFEFVALPAPAALALRATAKSLGVTFNDVVIAAILKGVSHELSDKRRNGRRCEIAVASIVNLRHECGFGDRDVFGQFLSSMRISHRVPADASLGSLAQDVHRETARVKKDKLYLQMLLAIRVNAVVWRFLDATRRQRLYAKAYPVLAGVTSLNVDALWQSLSPNGRPRDYVRAVPTGPIAPLVVAVTTADNGLALGLSFRRSALEPERVAKIAAFIADCVRSLQ